MCQLHISLTRAAQIYLELHFCVCTLKKPCCCSAATSAAAAAAAAATAAAADSAVHSQCAD